MLAVAASESVVETISDAHTQDVDLACYNTPHETVYAGPKAALEEMALKLSEKKVRYTQLRVPYTFHSAQVEPILADFEDSAKGITMHAPHTTISSTLGRVLGPDDTIDAAYLRQYCRQAVRFRQAIKHARTTGLINDATTLIEIGPHPTCSGMIQRTLGDQTKSLHILKRQENPWTAIVGSLVSLHDAGFQINWGEYYRDFERSCRLFHLPAYAFDNKDYWIAYRNDWTSRKGDPAMVVPPASSVPPQSKSECRISSSVHRVVEQDFESKDRSIIFETDLSDPEMHTAISGHRVNGSALCPSSLYADMALTIAQYIRQYPGSDFTLDGYDGGDVDVHQPLIVNPNPAD
jgi:acyl transferase domain-containing protein